MNASTAIRPSVATAFHRLVDYAGLFAPASLPMEPALAAYRQAKAGPHAWMLGSFVVPASRLDELLAIAGGAPPALAIIVDGARDARTWFSDAQSCIERIAAARDAHGLRIDGLEVPLPAPLAKRETFDAPVGQLGALLERAGFGDRPCYVETPRGDGWREGLPQIAVALTRARLRAKLRCGGTTAGAFPTVDEVASFVHVMSRAGVPWKATAGLHHPIRHRDSQLDTMQHGFTNLLAAAAFAPRLDDAVLADAIAEEDPAAFVFTDRSLEWRGHHASLDRLAVTRELGFVAYGSCSFDEPVADLAAAGLLPA